MADFLIGATSEGPIARMISGWEDAVGMAGTETIARLSSGKTDNGIKMCDRLRIHTGPVIGLFEF
ncbi:hypothetical protein [Oscillatoria acuminata]|uniref:hypothetical protein n=1 Tax=Oscillatoria acuminata TaxID=118323 RepID=UPI0012E9EB65|nr:hypothetical protein [Oscillatoria acuminata]